MKICSMRVENFLSFREAAFDFQDAGLVLVEGVNGSGKSAIIDALVWCLFGETLRGYKHDDVIHRKVGEGCLVQVCLEDDDELYTISRARRHSKLRNSLTVTHDNFGEDLTAAGDKETQLVVERLLGCTFKTFMSSVVFGQDRAYRFSSLTDGEQKKILDEVIGVERFAQACAAARKQVSAIQNDLDGARRAARKAEEARDEADAEILDLQAKNEDFDVTRHQKIEAEREKLAVAKKWVKASKKVDVDALKATVDKVLAELARRERVVEQASKVEADARVCSIGLATKRDELASDLKRRQKLEGDCPTCGQEIDDDKQAVIASGLRIKLKELKDAHVVASQAEAQAVELLSEAKRLLRQTRDAYVAAQKELNEGVGAGADAAAWKRRVADHMERIVELEREVNPYAELVGKARDRAKERAGDTQFWCEEISAIEEKLRRSQFWVKAFGTSGLRSLLVDSSLPTLNREAMRVSRVVTGGSISIEFSATSEQKSGKVVDRFEVKVDNEHGAGTYAGNSAGERAKVDLCVGLALQRLVASRSSASFNVAFFDEVLDHVDTAGTELVVDILSALTSRCDSIYVISHNEDLKSWFPASMRIVKRGGFSTVED